MSGSGRPKRADNGMRWWRENRGRIEPPLRRHVGGDGTILEVGMKVGTYDTGKCGRVSKLDSTFGYEWCAVVYEEGADTTTEYTKQCCNLFAIASASTATPVASCHAARGEQQGPPRQQSTRRAAQ